MGGFADGKARVSGRSLTQCLFQHVLRNMLLLLASVEVLNIVVSQEPIPGWRLAQQRLACSPGSAEYGLKCPVESIREIGRPYMIGQVALNEAGGGSR